jgi:hypothetical protein
MASSSSSALVILKLAMDCFSRALIVELESPLMYARVC